MYNVMYIRTCTCMYMLHVDVIHACGVCLVLQFETAVLGITEYEPKLVWCIYHIHVCKACLCI